MVILTSATLHFWQTVHQFRGSSTDVEIIEFSDRLCSPNCSEVKFYIRVNDEFISGRVSN